MKRPEQPFYGWRVVKATLAIAFVAWSFALYGSSVYIHALSQARGWTIGSLSTGLTIAFFVNAASIGVVGTLIGQHGPRGVMGVGAVLMATGIACIGLSTALWQAIASFAMMGLGWSCLSTIAVSSTIAPWFERQQGKAISTALLGASLGGMLGVPITLFLVDALGITRALLVIALIIVLTVIPLSTLVLRRRPQDMGLVPDGAADPIVASQQNSTTKSERWTRKEALKTYALCSVIVTFGLALMVQVGFLSQQVKLLQSSLTPGMIALTVFLSGTLAFGGRVVLARQADRVNIRLAAAMVLWVSAAGLLMAALATLADSTAWLIAGILLFGLNVGNLTTLPALIVRREFGAGSFGKVFGAAGTFMQLLTACGPALFGLLHDTTGSYVTPLFMAGVLMILGSLIVARGQWPWCSGP